MKKRFTEARMTVPSDTPRASRMAVFHASHGSPSVSAHHHTLEVEALEREVLKLCDGRCVLVE